MGQYFLGYVNHNKQIKVFDNHVDGDYVGLKLMEHSYWRNTYVGQIINDIFYNKGKVCWVGDYYEENDYEQVNCKNKETVRAIGKRVWDDKYEKSQIKGTITTSRTLDGCLLVNHTKKLYINGDKYYQNNKWPEEYEGKTYYWCVNPLPLLTCTASHSGGSYYGINRDLCGTWFNDTLEVIYEWEEDKLIEDGYTEFEPQFSERQ